MLFAWGANSSGQLGTGDVVDRSEPVPIHCDAVFFDTADRTTQPSTVLFLAGGGGHSVVSNGLHTFGCGSHIHGQIGHTSDPVLLHPIDLNTSHPIAAVACGWDFTLCLTNDGQLIGFGSNMHGQILGAPTPSYSVQPFRVTAPRVQMVSAGLRHALVVSADGEVLSWGANRRGQLGAPGDTSVSDVVRFTFNRLYGKPVCCSAGAQHSVVATDKGYVLVFGDLRYFHGPQAVDEPRAAGESRFLSFSRHLFGDRPVVQVASGWSHIVGRTDTGAVYTWGRADLGQLGRPNYPSIDSVGPRHDPTPGLVVFDDGENGRPVKIVDVAAGSEHSMALDENGRIWTWGWNEHGMCGILSVTDSDESGDHPLHGCLQRPTCVTFPSSNTYQSLRDPKAIAIGAGYGHSLAFVR